MPKRSNSAKYSRFRESRNADIGGCSSDGVFFHTLGCLKSHHLYDHRFGEQYELSAQPKLTIQLKVKT